VNKHSQGGSNPKKKPKKPMPILSFWGSVWSGEKPKNPKKKPKKPMPIYKFPETKNQKDPKKPKNPKKNQKNPKNQCQI
jgi:hypothetical protein